MSEDVLCWQFDVSYWGSSFYFTLSSYAINEKIGSSLESANDSMDKKYREEF